MAQYLTAILEEDNPSLLAAALGDIARVRDMTEIAKASGLIRSMDLPLESPKVN